MIQYIGNAQPALWDLDEKNRPNDESDESNLFNFFDFLNINPDWAQEKPEDAKQFFERLAQTVFRRKSSKEGREAQRILFNKYSDFFPSLRLKLGSKERNIPIDRLKALSDKFKLNFSGFREGNEKLFELQEPNDIDPTILPEIANDFLTYLETGELRFTEQNVFHLLTLAQENDVKRLEASCMKFIIKNVEITFDNVSDFFDYAIQKNNPDIEWLCYIFAYKNVTQDILLEYQYRLVTFMNSLKDRNLSPSSRKRLQLEKEKLKKTCYILESGRECQLSKTVPSFRDKGKTRMVTLSCIGRKKIRRGELPVSEDQLNLAGLKNLCSLVEAINLEDIIFLNDETRLKLENIYSQAKNLLIIRAFKFKDPIRCKDLKSVRTVLAPESSSVELFRCPKLSLVSAIKADKFHSVNCSSLKIMDSYRDLEIVNSGIEMLDLTSQAGVFYQKARCYQCSQLILIDAPFAVELDCASLNKLSNIFATNAKSLNITDCPKLKMVRIGIKTKLTGKLPPECIVVRVKVPQ